MIPHVVRSVLRSIAESEERVAGMKNSFARAEQINVGLNPMAGIRCIVWHLGKTLQDHMVDMRLTQSVSYFGIYALDRLEPPRVVGDIPFHPRPHPTWKMAVTSLSQRDCQVHLITEDKKVFPLRIVESLQQFGLRVPKAESRN
jgi:hypothetical protein